MKGKGFTLIELLAVIIILTIIALIAVPLVNNLIADSRKESAEITTKSILRAAKIYYGNESLKDTTFIEVTFKCDGISCKKCISLTGDICDLTDDNIVLKFDGDVPKEGRIKINKDGQTSISQILEFNNGNIYVGYNNSNNIVATEESHLVSGSQYLLLSCIESNDCEYGNLIGQTIKFDPVKGTKCISGDYCYDWNIVGYNNKTADILLSENLKKDNILLYVSWSNTTVELNMQVASWIYKTRLISASEVAKCSNQSLANSIEVSSFLEGYYWTSNEIDNSNAWAINNTLLKSDSKGAHVQVGCTFHGRPVLCYRFVYGIRPVITIEKDLFV